jgi:hypothetical protein
MSDQAYQDFSLRQILHGSKGTTMFMKSRFILTGLVALLVLSATGAYTQDGGGGDPSKKNTTKIPKTASRDPKTTTKPSLPSSKAPTIAELSINSNLPGCSVSLNNRPSGVTNSSGSLFLRSLKPGYYTVTLKKVGYQSSQRSINLSAGESQTLSFELAAIPGTLTVMTDVSGTQIEISNTGSYSDRVSGLSLRPGGYHLIASRPGYRTVARDFEIRSGETTNLPIKMEAIPVEETLAEALLAYNAKDYGRVLALCNHVLLTQPDSAKAHWLIGSSYYSQSRYAESVESFAHAIAAGGQVRLNIRHRRFVFGAGDDLSDGILSLDRTRFEFTSADRPNDSFTVPFAKVLSVKKELKRPEFGEWRFEVSVAIPKKNGKEDKKDFDFYSIRAGTKRVTPQGNKYPTSVIYCDNCESEIDALYRLIYKVKSLSSQISAAPTDKTARPPALKRANSASEGSSSISIASPSARFRSYAGSPIFRIGVPENWVEVTKLASTIVFAPEGAFVKVGGRYDFFHGMQVGTVPSRSLKLAEAFDRFVSVILKDSGYLTRVSPNQPANIKGRAGLSAALRGTSPVMHREESVLIYGVMMKNGSLFYLITVTPQEDVSVNSPTFRTIIDSIEFLD